MATVLAPGTPLGDDPRGYVATHQLAWRIGWSLWIVAAVSLVTFYAWWSLRIGRARVAPLVATIGLVGDVAAEMLLIQGPPEAAPLAFLVTAVWANGLYAVAGAMLTLAAPLPRALAVAAWIMWGASAGIAVGGAIGAPLLTAAATAVVFTILPPWCVAMGRSLR